MRVLLKYLAYLLFISSLFIVVPVAAGLIYGEPISLFVISFIVSISLGAFFLYFSNKQGKKESSSLTLSKGLMLVALSFIILPIIGSISFLPSFNYSPADALFESVSGFTTTGLTLYDSLEGLPKSLLLWRAETQWMGGIGIIMVFLFIFSRLRSHTYSQQDSASESSMALYQAQGFPEKLEPGLKKTAQNILLIYSIYTALGIMLLFVAGMPFFDSIAMSFTSLSTGGFTVKDVFYTNSFQLAVLCILMLLGSISFLAHNKLLQRKFKEFIYSFEKNVFFVILAAAMAIALASHFNIGAVAFEVISAFTTTGYSISKIALFPQLLIAIIMAGMIIGGSVASTSGGIKVFRLYYVLKSIPWMIKKLSSPGSAIIPFKVNNNPVDEDNIMIVNIFVASYMLILFIGTLIFMIFGYSFMDSSFQVTSALGTVGLQTMKLGGINIVCKLVLMAAMVLGRLEIFPLLVLIRGIIKRNI